MSDEAYLGWRFDLYNFGLWAYDGSGCVNLGSFYLGSRAIILHGLVLLIGWVR